MKLSVNLLVVNKGPIISKKSSLKPLDDLEERKVSKPITLEQSDIQKQEVLQAKARAKACMTCEGMKDFVSNLQNEIKRLKTITEDLMS